MSNVDEQELDKFSQIAHKWWDMDSEFKPLHEINPLRLDFIDQHAALAGKAVLDVGCGGGILSESMAHYEASVTGIDLAKKSLKVAQLHSLESGVSVNYRCVAVEDLAAEAPASFDVVTCMEMLEHVPDPQSIVRACAQLVKPGGWVFFSTLNRNAKSYLLAVLGAEYVLNMLPKGTHEYARFLKPSELSRMARNAGLGVETLAGIGYNPLTRVYSLNDDTDVNYLMATRRLA
ncbi:MULTISPECIES: bifunctional 2-polyprenyl-6-hydroxyphenol methylase/3-demethylubiquinol 3-O-methyltransferase UbiG [Vogesella]|uniref:Ubiquinone biosynthesis O-methyltransferase n=1 Tax=Vogesella alkaliphila TaxID=1193621 RepID=A0ABQ2YW17_9NEIS|nr:MULTISPECIES: bifunctional 2-polyprenyl-6-hydroxyphenol methylase/3-demethylubiquinol 3-O-methyltransferase UbiG [Vogesella]MDC7702515.1 bifunctional 2-polyprenyl-6-hydroxyphenol methylase/3-demethylubiquinol 3-O-methyltransferase UbiG [Vogesella indigofera]GGX94092.1 ubiquinone biosynthesis O-methyltransferase [Vogesella alkaliphila]